MQWLTRAETVTNNTRRYITEFGGSMAAYVVVLFLSRWILQGDLPDPWVIPVALLPILPIPFAIWALMRAHRRLDELAQKVHFEALAFAFAGTALACVTYGFLEDSFAPPLSEFWVFTLMMVLLIIGKFFAKRHYR